MKYLPLICYGLWRKPARTVLVALSLAVGFLLFGILDGVNSAFDQATQRAQLDRLLVDPRFGVPLPLAHAEQIRKVPRVTHVAWTQFFGGAYQDPKNNVVVVATDPRSFFKMRDEYDVSPEMIETLANTRTGVIFLDKLATRYGWKKGDKVTITQPGSRKDGSAEWTFDVVGIMSNPGNPGAFGIGVINYEYFDEARSFNPGTVGRVIARVNDPARSVEVARAIDKLFESSAAPTRTKNENESARTRLAIVGDVSKFTRAVIAAVFFALLFLTGNTMLQSVRERSSELATLKVLGFSDAAVLMMIFGETLLVCTVSAVAGLAIAAVAFPQAGEYIPSLVAYLGPQPMATRVIVLGLVCAVAIAAVSALLPAWRTLRIKVVDALASR
jgi:putative ABC transport system permease protein